MFRNCKSSTLTRCSTLRSATERDTAEAGVSPRFLQQVPVLPDADGAPKIPFSCFYITENTNIYRGVCISLKFSDFHLFDVVQLN